MESLFVKIVLAVVKKALSIGGGALVADGVLNSEQSTQALGALMTLIGIGWEAYQTYSQHKAAKAPPDDLIAKAVSQAKQFSEHVEVSTLPPAK